MRFGYEYDDKTRLFKFYEQDFCSYACYLQSAKAARRKANRLIKEVKKFESRLDRNKNKNIRNI